MNVKVNVGPKSRVAEDNLLALRNQKLIDPLEKGFPIESDASEILQLFQEAEKKQKEVLLELDQNGTVHNKTVSISD